MMGDDGLGDEQQKWDQDGYVLPAEGHRDGPTRPRPQGPRVEAQPVGGGGECSSGPNAFSQDDLTTFLAWRSERRRGPRPGNKM